ncbi:hypothetical protein PVK06_021114 [Gossypium arboreum]|uniref:Retrotransposon Copia-like N-terminal domain-containing protein n=1 Tax=Gossypium arboreum TaxID=29729 RepID=A0ABR0PPC2_GOSAR|nr:hypothetical protein PVK06_021114 [Gossypium arboreum]
MSTDENLVIPTNNPSLQISPMKLGGQNYLAWSRLMAYKDTSPVNHRNLNSLIQPLVSGIQRTLLLWHGLSTLWNSIFPKPYSFVQQEEIHRVVMLYNPPLAKTDLIANQDAPSDGKSAKDHFMYDYCGKPRHTEDSC